MSGITFTDAQRRAIETIDRSVLVSAAAGSGKTAVLAQRCAYLVCDAPPERRCDVDQLLVLTFTDAAAAEMRLRIVDTIRDKLDDQPDNQRLPEQLALVDTARISTVHAFCQWLVRRSFGQLGLDPSFTVLDAQDAALLGREVLDALFERGFAASLTTKDRRGNSEEALIPASGTTADVSADESAEDAPGVPDGMNEEELFDGFAALIDHYGLGESKAVRGLILELQALAASMPDSDRWLRQSMALTVDRTQACLTALLCALQKEMDWQVEHGNTVIEEIEQGDPIGAVFAAALREYVAQLQLWRVDRGDARVGDVADGNKGAVELHAVSAEDCPARYDRITAAIGEYTFPSAKSVRLGKDCDPAVRLAYDRAKKIYGRVRDTCYKKRLRSVFGLFSSDEQIAGLHATQPYVRTIVRLVQAFDEEFSAKKRQLNVVDFTDLERFAFDLLTNSQDRSKPSLVAQRMQRRFRQVLVDEFQDINPIQEALIRAVSREGDPQQDNNLFVVGDVKQSIYRFRLAEPSIFVDRANRFRRSADEGSDVSLALQKNFRSRPEILDTVNLIFRQLLPAGFGEIVYDDQAQLTVGLTPHDYQGHEPVEVHLLERTWDPDQDGQDNSAGEPTAINRSPEQWSAIEREAYLIGLRIKALIDPSDSCPPDRNINYRDIAILLRAARVNGERMAAMLNNMGIPAYADVSGSLFDALEIRDVLSALKILDNSQQDVPIAAVLRSGLFGERFEEDDLVEIRCLDRDQPFHACVRDYSTRGTDQPLRERLACVLHRIEGFRKAVRRRPLPEVLRSLYDKHGYLAYAGGLPGGRQRRANLLKLLTLSRKFQTFRRQGLHRFLRFVEALRDGDQFVAAAPTVGESEDVVRIMTIHHSKGLEFPIVFLAGLGTKFNLRDRSGRMLMDRRIGIGLRVVDREKMVEYPSALHELIVQRVARATCDEELRVLYVAMTRAQRKLILVGSAQGIVAKTRDCFQQTLGVSRPLARLTIATATTMLDWILPALARAPADWIAGVGGRNAKQPTVRFALYDQEAMADWQVGRENDDQRRRLLQAVADVRPLPAAEPMEPGRPDVEAMLNRLAFVYPRLPAATTRAAIGVSEAKRLYEEREEWEIPTGRADWPTRGGLAGERVEVAAENADVAPGSLDEAARRGSLTHRVLQNLDFAQARDAPGLASELQRMFQTGLIGEADVAMVDQASIVWFLSTPLAARLRRAGSDYRREFSFVARESPALFDRTLGEVEEERVLVRGIVDGVLLGEQGLEIIDFKTDAVDASQAASRAQSYRTQMALYARAMSKLWDKPIERAILVFLTARQLIEVTDLTL